LTDIRKPCGHWTLSIRENQLHVADRVMHPICAAIFPVFNCLRATCNWRSQLAPSFACSEAAQGPVLNCQALSIGHFCPVSHAFKRLPSWSPWARPNAAQGPRKPPFRPFLLTFPKPLRDRRHSALTLCYRGTSGIFRLPPASSGFPADYGVNAHPSKRVRRVKDLARSSRGGLVPGEWR
jgi:hypothetical protein